MTKVKATILLQAALAASGDRTTVNSLRFGTGPVFRIGEVSDQSAGQEDSSPQP